MRRQTFPSKDPNVVARDPNFAFFTIHHMEAGTSAALTGHTVRISAQDSDISRYYGVYLVLLCAFQSGMSGAKVANNSANKLYGIKNVPNRVDQAKAPKSR